MRLLGVALVAVLGVGGCLAERDDFLVGRTCSFTQVSDCDEGQVCLPHAYTNNRPDDFRCRDRASFSPVDGRDGPIAFCDPALGLRCPAGIVCGPGRIRADSGPRRPICKSVDDGFGPPLVDGGV